MTATPTIRQSDMTTAPTNGEIVVARVGEENRVTLKRFYVNANSIELRPENPKYGSLFSKDVTVLGKLQMIIRDYEH